MKRILVTGACGQIGSELTLALRKRYGVDNVVATGHTTKPSDTLYNSGPFHFIDCTDIKTVVEVMNKYRLDTIYHLAARLSAVAEANPQQAWVVNINGLYNMLEIAREYKCAIFVPSSIGAFGPNTPHDNTPQDTIQRPNTMYGVTKVAGELLCDYYFKRFDVDTRGVRFPGIISYITLPGGGTTDYAVEIYYEAIKHRQYTCFLKAGTYLDMMYMPDTIKAAIDIMEADQNKLIHRNSFNVSAMSFSPDEIATEIRKYIPDFVLNYKIDPIRQEIADSWPNNMDDSCAREEWGWKPQYDLSLMTSDMIGKLCAKLKIQI
jgi:nucleoside-diphosphate-sugar epimerase